VKPSELCLAAGNSIQVIVNKDAETPQAQPAPAAGPPAESQDHHEAEIRNELERIRTSRCMSGCNRLLQLLDFVVNATLRGDASHLKETTIGVEVFGRSPDYDPKVDTIVRSQAWRLRTKLRKYYATEGLNDPMTIDVPTGQYVPSFHVREQVEIGG
jgi:hypothetical protein